MVSHFDHMTIVVRDLDVAKRFFGLLGFVHERSVVISGEVFSRYMGVAGLEADHVTLVLQGVVPRTEIQLLGYRSPAPVVNPQIEQLNTLGYNHLCFAVNDLEADLQRLREAGVETRSEVLHFHGRKLVFLRGPEGITVELSERSEAAPDGPMDQAQVRQAVPSDLPDLTRLLDAYRVFYGGSSDPEAAREFLRQRFQHGESTLFLALLGGVAAGFCQLYPSFSSVSLARTFILNDLYVEPAARHRGLATQLLQAAARYATAVGAIRLSLATAIDNQAAQALYAANGWVRDEQFHVYQLKLPCPTPLP